MKGINRKDTKKEMVINVILLCGSVMLILTISIMLCFHYNYVMILICFCYNMIISMEEEQNILEYQKTMKVHVKNIAKTKKNIWRPIYEVIDSSFFEKEFQNIFRHIYLGRDRKSVLSRCGPTST